MLPSVKRVAGFAALALVAGGMAFAAPAAQARIDLGINLGVPVAPVYVAPAPVYAAPPPVVYSPYPATGYYAPPAVVVQGHWGYDRWGHRHWVR